MQQSQLYDPLYIEDRKNVFHYISLKYSLSMGMPWKLLALHRPFSDTKTKLERAAKTATTTIEIQVEYIYWLLKLILKKYECQPKSAQVKLNL